MASIVSRGIAEARISAKVIRADGTVEDLGLVAYHSKSPWKRLAWRVRRAYRRLMKHGR